MNDMIETTMQSPIEVALGIDEDGMTTARKLYEFLGLNSKNYSHWCKRNITENEFATENEDYWAFVPKDEREFNPKPTTDYRLTASFAKKLSMMAKSEKGEQARKYFVKVEDGMKELAVKEFGSVEEWKKHYIEAVSSEEMQKGYAKVVEWYGGKEKYLSVVNNPISKDVADSYNKRIEAVLQKLIAKRNCDVNSSEVQEVVEEYGLLMKQFSQIKEEQGFMMAQAQYYRNERIKSMTDEKYGEGTADFLAQAIEAFYK